MFVQLVIKGRWDKVTRSYPLTHHPASRTKGVQCASFCWESCTNDGDYYSLSSLAQIVKINSVLQNILKWHSPLLFCMSFNVCNGSHRPSHIIWNFYFTCYSMCVMDLVILSHVIWHFYFTCHSTWIMDLVTPSHMIS